MQNSKQALDVLSDRAGFFLLNGGNQPDSAKCSSDCIIADIFIYGFCFGVFVSIRLALTSVSNLGRLLVVETGYTFRRFRTLFLLFFLQIHLFTLHCIRTYIKFSHNFFKIFLVPTSLHIRGIFTCTVSTVTNKIKQYIKNDFQRVLLYSEQQKIVFSLIGTLTPRSKHS